MKIERSEDKNLLLKICRANLPEQCLKWIDASFTICSDDEVRYNPILGTGGNEGRLDFTNNFMRQIVRLLIGEEISINAVLLQASLFGHLTKHLFKVSIGQYDPGKAGGYNQGQGIESKDFKINPWDYVLMMEGTLMFAGALVRKSVTDYRGLLSSPFSVNFSPVGFTSSNQTESGRGEVWLPLWGAPAGLPELKHFFAEGRASIGRRPAKNGMEFARATGQLGVDRGVPAFERYAFLKRRGQSFVALPAGRIGVGFRPELELLGDIDGHLDRVDTFLRQFKTVPVSFSRQRRILDENLFACATKPDTRSFGMVLRAFGRLDALISQRDRSKNPAFAKPIFGLSTKWLEACDDGGLEVRVAAALASIGKTGGVGPFRSSLSPVDPDRPWLWAKGRGQAEWVGSSLCERLGGILLRRIMDAERTGAKHAPFSGAIRLTTEDAAACALGLYDPMVFEDFLWGFSLIDFSKPVPASVMSRWSKPVEEMVLPREWYLLKLLHSPTPIRDVVIRLEPRVSRLLAAGRVQEACEIAEYRLRVSGLSPFLAVYDSVLNPCDLLWSLMIPIARQHDLEKVVLVPTQPKE